MFEETIKVPRDRVAVLIGKGGEIKKRIEKLTNTNLKIDSKDGIVDIMSEDRLNLFNAKPIIRAVARGFNPKIAEKLTNEDNCLEVIDLNNYAKHSNKKMMRIKSRCIGKEGAAKAMIEDLTQTDICIYGKTISIIGNIENVNIAKKAIDSLLMGSKHGNAYAQISRRKNEIKRELSL